MKMAPLYKALKEQSDRYLPSLIHTGQHYDEKMSKLFLMIWACRNRMHTYTLGQGPMDSTYYRALLGASK